MFVVVQDYRLENGVGWPSTYFNLYMCVYMFLDRLIDRYQKR